MIDAVDRLAPGAILSSDDFGYAPYDIAGRCMMADGEELVCTAIKASTTHAAIVGARRVETGEIVVCCLDGIGILRGRVVRPLRDGFILAFDLSTTRRREVEASLKWHETNARKAADQRGAPRIVPVSRVVDVRYGEHLTFRGIILNISVSGAAIAMKPANLPFEGSLIKTGRRFARVVRLVERGVAVQFVEPFDAATFDHHVVL